MRWLANENVARPVVLRLRELGHDVSWCVETGAGARDVDVLARAQLESRTVLTCDKDFGELAVGARLPASCGVVLLRVEGNGPGQDNERILEALTSREDWSGHFAVVERDRIRLRPLA